MLDTTALKNELQTRINALTNASTFDQVIEVAIAAKKASSIGVILDQANLNTQLQRVTNAVGAASAIEDLIILAASASTDGLHPPIGHVKSCPFSGDKFTDSSGHEWLLKGLLHTKAGYEKALEQKALRSYGQLVYPGGVNGMITQAATDGLGTVVIATSNATHVLVVKDGGNTVTAVPHNLPGKATGVIFVGGAFVVASNTAAAINTSHSTNAGESFSVASVARVLTSGVADSVRGSSDGTTGLFVASGDVACVSFTSGTVKANRTLPVAVIGSYIPLVQAANGVIIIGRKNTNSYLRTTDGGANFSTINAPVSSVIFQDMTYALGKFFWCGHSGSTYYFFSSVNGLDWVDVSQSIPEPFRSHFGSLGGSLFVRVFSVTGGMVLGLQNSFYFTTDFVNFELINFSRSAEELGGSNAQYFCFRNLVMGGFSLNESQGGSKSAMLKVDYTTPDYVGFHFNGASNIIEGMCDYVRIK